MVRKSVARNGRVSSTLTLAKMTIYEEIKRQLKEHNHTIEDILFVRARSDYFEEDINIPLDLFFETAKELDKADLTENLLIVGQDFWLDSGVQDIGYLDYYEVPSRGKEISIEEYMLLNPEVKPSVLFGIEFEDE